MERAALRPARARSIACCPATKKARCFAGRPDPILFMSGTLDTALVVENASATRRIRSAEALE
jgi:hypothetical protein